MHNTRQIVPSREVHVGAGGYLLNNLAEIDQIRGIDDRSRSAAGASG